MLVCWYVHILEEFFFDKMMLQNDISSSNSSLTLTLSSYEPIAFGAGAGVAAGGVDADLRGVTVVGVRLTFVNVWNREKWRETQKLPRQTGKRQEIVLRTAKPQIKLKHEG